MAVCIDLNLSPQLLQELTDSFRFFDRNGDGRIDAAELGVVVRSLQGQKVSDAEIDRLMREVDTNGDGFIDLQEFMDLNTRALFDVPPVPVAMSSCTAPVGAVDAAMLQSAFNVFDVDKDGFISADELHCVLVGFGDESVSLHDCRCMIQCVDEDGDGVVNFREFVALMNSGSFRL